MDRIVFDVEIQKTIEELPRGWDQTEDMGVACCCVWEYTGQRMRIYGPDDVNELQARLLEADEIIGFNTWSFDIPVIWGFSREEWRAPRSERKSSIVDLQQELSPKSNDLLRRIWRSLQLNPDVFTNQHKGWGLDVVAGETLGARKIGYGGDAPKWFQQGLWAKVANYCADDTALERDLSDFIDKYRYVLGKAGRIVRLPEFPR